MSAASRYFWPGRDRDADPGRTPILHVSLRFSRSPSQRPDSLARERARARIRACMQKHTRDIGTLGRIEWSTPAAERR
jgi:hypothetical protein